MIIKEDIKAKFIQSMNLSTYHHTMYRDNELGIQIETVTKKKGGFATDKANTGYFIDGDKHEFKTLDELVTAYNELFPNGRPDQARKQMKSI